MLKKLLLPFILLSCLLLTSCSDDEPITPASLIGSWSKQYPEGLQTEGGVIWQFVGDGELFVNVYDAFAGDFVYSVGYTLQPDAKTLTIEGTNIENDGPEKLAEYKIVKLTDKELKLKRTWHNDRYLTGYDPTTLNPFQLGGFEEITLRRNRLICGNE